MCWIVDAAMRTGWIALTNIPPKELHCPLCTAGHLVGAERSQCQSQSRVKLVQVKWDVAVHGRDLYLVKPTLGPPKKFQHLTRAEVVVITRLRIGHQIPYLVPRTTNWLSPLWSNTDHWPNAAGMCIVTGISWWILHSRLIECSLRDNSWDLHSRIPAEAGFFYLIWCNLLTSISPRHVQYDQTWVII